MQHVRSGKGRDDPEVQHEGHGEADRGVRLHVSEEKIGGRQGGRQQESGETVPLFVRKDFMQLSPSDEYRREKDLDKHLESHRKRGKKTESKRVGVAQ